MRTSSLRLGQRSRLSHLGSDDPRQIDVLRRACRGVVGRLENLEQRQLLTGVVEWLMNEGPGSTIVNDTAPDGVAQTGELIDGPTWVADRNGTAGRAISLDGINDYINGSDDFSPWVGNTTTVSFWLKTTARGSDNPRATASVIGTGASSLPEQDIFFGFLDASGRIGLHVPGTLPTGVANAKDTVKSTQRVNDGTWHHIAMTRDTVTGDIKIYVDGFLNDSGVANADVRNSAPMRNVGLTILSTGSAFFNGQIDEFRIDNEALGDAQVGQLFNPTGALPGQPTALNISYSGARALRLNWTPGTNVSYYEVWRRNAGTGAFAKLPTIAIGNSFFDTGLTPNTGYDYYLVAVNNVGSSAQSNTVTGTTTAVRPPGTGDGLLGIYYDDDGGPEGGRGGDATPFNSTGRIATRIDPNIAFFWGGQPHPRIGAEDFTVNWHGQLEALYSEPHTFFKASDDGFIMEIELTPGVWTRVFNDFGYHGHEAAPGMMSDTIDLVGGQKYNVRFETFDGCCDAGATLRWTNPSTPLEIVPQSQFYSPAVPANAPAAPSGLNAEPGANPNTIALSWSDNSSDPNAELGFIILRSPTATGTFTEIARMAAGSTSYTDNVYSGATYFYQVKSFNLRGESAASNTDSASSTALPVGPGIVATYWANRFLDGAPVGNRVEPRVDTGDAHGFPGVGADNFSIRYNGTLTAPQAGNYTFFVSTDDGARLWVNNQLVSDEWRDQGTTEFTSAVVPLTAGQKVPILLEYYENGGGAVIQMRWRATDAAGTEIIAKDFVPTTALTTEVARPVAPGSAMPTNIFSRSAVINWLDTAGELEYYLERATQADFTGASEIARLPAGTTSFRDLGLQGGQTYYYRIRAANVGGYSTYTNLPNVTTVTDEPVAAAPTNLVASSLNNRQIQVRWTDNALNETGYIVQRKTGAGGTYATVATLGDNVTTYTDTGEKTEGTEYFYRVIAVNSENEQSAPSNEDGAVAVANTLPAPWAAQQIGGGIVGDTVYDSASDSYHITGGGSDIWGNSDEFQYMYQPVNGDFVITTRVVDQIRTHEWSKAGLEVREKLTGPSRHVGLYATGDHDPEFSWRHTEGGATDNRRPYNSANMDYPQWLRIARVGDTFHAWTSLDGVNYMPVDTDAAAPGIQHLPIPNNIDYPDTMYVGLAVSGVGGTFGDATFDQLDLQTVTAPVPASDVTAEAMPSGRAFVQWTSSPGELGAQVERREGAAGAWTPVGTELYGGTGEFIDTGLTPGVQYSYRVVSSNSKGAAAASTPSAAITASAGSTTLPTGWTAADVGQVGLPGSTTFTDNPGEDNDVFQVNGGGVDIWSNNDEFQFVYQQLTGDFTITTRLLSQERTAEWSKAGLDVRESLTNNVRHVGIFATGDHDPEYAIRPTVDAQTTNVRPRNSFNMDAPIWFRIQRTGDNFKAFYSGDGVNWLPVDTNGGLAGHQGYDLDLPDTVYVGLAVSAVNDGDVSTAEFDNTTIVVDGGPTGITLNGTAGNDNWHLKRNGTQIEVRNNADGSGAPVSTHNLGESLLLNGLDGDDTVTVDMSGGDINLSSLTITGANGTDKIRLTNGDGKVLTLGAVPTLNGEYLDLGTADLTLTGVAPAAVEALLKSARDGAVRWQGPGIGTSSATADTGLSPVAQGADTLVKYTWNGDVNGDGRINADDYFRIDSGFLDKPANPLYVNGDFNFDDQINADDYFLIDSAFLGQNAVLSSSSASAAVASTSSTSAIPDNEGTRKAKRVANANSALFGGKRIEKRAQRRARG